MMKGDNYKIRITKFEEWFLYRVNNFKDVSDPNQTFDGRDIIDQIYIPDPTAYNNFRVCSPLTGLLKGEFNNHLKRQMIKQQRNDDQCIDGRIGLKLLSKDKSITEDKTYWLEGCWFPYN